MKKVNVLSLAETLIDYIYSEVSIVNFKSAEALKNELIETLDAMVKIIGYKEFKDALVEMIVDKEFKEEDEK